MKHRLPLRTPEEKSRAKAWIDKAPVGWSVEFRPPTRTLAQNDRLYPFLQDIADQKEWEGKKRTRYFWKDLFTAALRGQELVRGLEGGLVAIGAHTSEMGVEEMSDLLQLVETWGAQNGIEFTDKPETESPSCPGGERGEDQSAGAQRGASPRSNSEDA